MSDRSKMVVFTLLLAILTTANALWKFPLHASCSVSWKFGKSCDQVKNSIVTQIHEWETDDNCKNGGEKCLYKLLTEEKTKITGTHTTPVKKYVDDISFIFNPQEGGLCEVNGYSTSQVWYAVLDYGTNYCNLHNLVVGAGLDRKDKHYLETTSDGICTQYSSADCEVY